VLHCVCDASVSESSLYEVDVSCFVVDFGCVPVSYYVKRDLS
jgi:hypothetical protein